MLAATLCAPAAAQDDADSPARLMLFSDATYLWTERDVNEGFSLGQVVAHLNAVLAPRLSTAVEATLTSRETGPIATLERLILAYDVSDALRISAGRYHTPISWWNTQFHHGLWLQNSIDRPNMVRFGTPLIPVHFLGLLASGKVPMGTSTLVYEAGVGNGRADDLVGAGDAGEDGGEPAWVGGLRFRPGLLTGLELGVHGYLDELDDAAVGEVAERILGGHVVWQANPEILFEYLRFDHDPGLAGAGTVASDAFYVQVGFRLPPRPSIQPYARVEAVDVGTGDPLFTPGVLDYEGVIAGVRFDFADFAALKGELRLEEVGAEERRTSVALNASFVVPNIIQ